MISPEDHDALWDLLGQARRPVVSPYFARRVVREVRQTRPPATVASLLRSLLRYWQLPALAACVVAIAVNGLRPHAPSDATAAAYPEATLAMLPDAGVIGHLDELIDSEKNSVWLAGDTE